MYYLPMGVYIILQPETCLTLLPVACLFPWTGTICWYRFKCSTWTANPIGLICESATAIKICHSSTNKLDYSRVVCFKKITKACLILSCCDPLRQTTRNKIILSSRHTPFCKGFLELLCCDLTGFCRNFSKVLVNAYLKKKKLDLSKHLRFR